MSAPAEARALPSGEKATANTHSPWGFFRHWWIVIKWVLTSAMILFGIFFLGPWVDRTATLAAERGLVALGDPLYTATALRVLGFSVLQIALLVFMLFLSTFKPFGKR